MKFHDSQNQLIREDNQAAGKSWTWEYDDAGNILNRKEYAHTTGNLGTVLDTVTYGYGNANWGDLLTSYDGQTITYDSIGNPLNDGTWTYTWEHGRQLASMTDGTTTWTYTYDANGMRTSRTNGSSTYSYIYNGSQLSQMGYVTNGTTITFNFYYDAAGQPLSVNIDGTDYYYVTDLQGDVTAILNTSGTKVASYEYDAWGKILSSSIVPSSATDVYLAFNPLRYRAYVYDQESELYYLQSRYYDSEIGRFLNGDTYISTGQGFIGSNMFAYCLNNPVCNHDPSGKRVPIWPILFGDHRFGFIHEAVQLHIIATGLFEKEFRLEGIGRADIIDPETMEIWEIKHGGSTTDMQNDRINQALDQIGKYITNKIGIPLKKGHAGAFTGAFVINCGNISYAVSYNTPEPGVILYYVQEMKNYEPAASYAYIPSTSTADNTLKYMLALAVIGAGLSALDPVCVKHYAVAY